MESKNMSKILGLEKVDTSQLSEGLEVKNYRALCELVGEEPKTGNGKKAQLKEWERFFAVEKVKGSQKMIVTEIYERPVEIYRCSVWYNNGYGW